jgi:hypothetical protein
MICQDFAPSYVHQLCELKLAKARFLHQSPEHDPIQQLNGEVAAWQDVLSGNPGQLVPCVLRRHFSQRLANVTYREILLASC